MPRPAAGAWTRGWLAWLRSTEELGEQSRRVVDRQLVRLSQLEQEVAEVETRLREAVAGDPVVEKLLTLKGVGPVTAVTIRAEVGRFDRFRTGKQLARFCGLSPRNASSGSRQADAGLIKAGSPGGFAQESPILTSFLCSRGDYCAGGLPSGLGRGGLAVSMSHKAFSFDWHSFERDELRRLLFDALDTGDASGLFSYVAAHRRELRDPYEGGPLREDWMDLLENRDVQEAGDFALTRFYDPADDRGLGPHWQPIDAELPDSERRRLLGTPFGPVGSYFDPGRQGSYFQAPDGVLETQSRFDRLSTSAAGAGEADAVERFRSLLAKCAASGRGLYVTF